MIDYNLTTIDWTAIGSIATTIALFVAYYSVIKANKESENNRKLQILLLRQEKEQKQLDEMIENIINIAFALKPIDVLNYSSKFLNNSFSDKDRLEIESIQNIDRQNTVRLNVQIKKISNYDAAKPFLFHLGNLKKDFSLWAKSINLLYLSIYKQEYASSNITSEMINKIITEMENRCCEIEPRYLDIINDIKNKEKNEISRCANILTIFESELSCQLINHINSFEKEFYQFVDKEQKRINKIVE